VTPRDDAAKAAASIAIETEGLSKRYVAADRSQFTPPVPVLSRLFGNAGSAGSGAGLDDDDDDDLDDLDEGDALDRPVLTESTGATTWLLRDVSVAFPRGAVVGLVGPPDGGKTTLLRIIGGLTQPTVGRATVRGRVSPLVELGATLMRIDRSPATNVRLLARVSGFPTRRVRRRMEGILEFAGASSIRPGTDYPKALLRQLAIATALHVDADIVVIETMKGLDADFRDRCTERLADLGSQGTTVLLVSDDTESMRRICSEVIWFDAGEVVESGNPDHVLDAYRLQAEATSPSASHLDLVLPPAFRTFNKLMSICGARVTAATDVDNPTEPNTLGIEVEIELSQFPLSVRLMVGFYDQNGRRYALSEPEPRPLGPNRRYSARVELPTKILPHGTWHGFVYASIDWERGRAAIAHEDAFAIESNEDAARPLPKTTGVIEIAEDGPWPVTLSQFQITPVSDDGLLPISPGAQPAIP
jgi:ABC-type polysaccharide/polyol phosphate transport system ATPase subunit